MTSLSTPACEQADHSGQRVRRTKVAKFLVDKNVPMPNGRPWNRNSGYSENCVRYPFRSMEVTDSFFIAGGEEAHARYTIKSNVLSYARRHGVKFATRSVEEEGIRGLRIWRIA